jgi:hypothetical protein
VEPQADLKHLHAKIGQLALDNDFFVRHTRRGGTAGREAMIDRTHDLPLNRQVAGDAAEPVPGDGHHLHPDAVRLFLSSGGDRLVQPEGHDLAALDHHGRRLLHRGRLEGAGFHQARSGLL